MGLRLVSIFLSPSLERKLSSRVFVFCRSRVLRCKYDGQKVRGKLVGELLICLSQRLCSNTAIPAMNHARKQVARLNPALFFEMGHLLTRVVR